MVNAVENEGLVIRAGGQTRTKVMQLLRSQGVLLNDHAETLISHPAFEAPESQRLRIVERTVKELGFEKGAVQSRVFTAAKEQGLRPCPLVAGPYLRLAMMGTSQTPWIPSCPPAALQLELSTSLQNH